MNKVVTIHLNGVAHQLEEAGYDALRAYLESAGQQLAGNPDKDEIISDIEQSISDKFRSLTNVHRNVVLAKDVADVIAAMGPVDDGSNETSKGDASASSTKSREGSSEKADAMPPPKRLYRIQEGAMISGVCNGIGAYFGIDPTLIRIVWVVLAFVTFGVVAAAYLAFVFLVPEARTDSERATAHGAPATAQEFINRARAGYYDAAKKFGDRETRREWKRKFHREMHQWRRSFKTQMRTQQWQHWQAQSMAAPGVWFTVTLLTLLSIALTVLWLFALLSLLLKGAVFGFTLPAGVPIWVAILLLCILFQCIASPIRMSRHAFYHGGHSPPCFGGPGGLIGTLSGLAFLALGLWLVDLYVPHAHEFFVQIPPTLEKLALQLREWWAQR